MRKYKRVFKEETRVDNVFLSRWGLSNNDIKKFNSFFENIKMIHQKLLHQKMDFNVIMLQHLN